MFGTLKKVDILFKNYDMGNLSGISRLRAQFTVVSLDYSAHCIPTAHPPLAT